MLLPRKVSGRDRTGIIDRPLTGKQTHLGAAMDDDVTDIDALRKHGLALKRSITAVNRDLDRAMHAVASGKTGRALRILESRFREYAGLMFELGKVEEQLRALRGQTHEQVHDHSEPEKAPVRADDWQEQVPVVEDLLDWLPALPEVPDPAENVRDGRQHGAERELGQMPDHEDWLKR